MIAAGRFTNRGSSENADTRECNAPRVGRKAVCIFHAGAAPAVIENIYMLFMGHTCLKNQTRATELTLRRLASTFRVQTLFPPLFLRLPPFFCFVVPCGTAYSALCFFLFLSISCFLHPLPRQHPPVCSCPRYPATTYRQRLENSTKRFTPLLPLPFPSTDETTNARMD